MENEVHTVASTGAGLRVFYVAFQELNAMKVFEVFAFSSYEVIYPADRSSLGE
jgi:hypothetical protein